MSAKGPAATKGPVSKNPSDYEQTILSSLTEVRESIGLIRPRSEDWVWPVRATSRLLSSALIAVLETRRAKSRHLPDEGAAWCDEDLPGLVSRGRKDGIAVRDGADHAADRLMRLTRDLSWIVGTWEVLGDQIPGLIRETLTVTGGLLWEDSAGPDVLSGDGKEKAWHTASQIEGRLLFLEAERMESSS